MIFPVVMYGCDSWSKKKVEHWRIDAFKLWVWRRLLLILKKISPEYSLEGLLLKLKLQYFGYLMWRADSLKKILMMGEIEGRRRRARHRVRQLDGITDSMSMSSGILQEILKEREAWCIEVHGITKSQIWLGDWTTTTIAQFCEYTKNYELCI